MDGIHTQPLKGSYKITKKQTDDEDVIFRHINAVSTFAIISLFTISEVEYVRDQQVITAA